MNARGLGILLTLASSSVAMGGSGSCCLPDGSCVEVNSELTCYEQFNGLEFLPGNTCAQTQCIARPCCLPSGICVVIDPSACFGQGGQMGQPNTTCAEIQCSPVPTGACCTDKTTCDVVTQDECENFLGGVYQGDDTACTPGICGGSIPGDTNGDGVVGIGDLLSVIGAWGPCQVPQAPCPQDFNGDGQVGIGDLLTVIGNWG